VSVGQGTIRRKPNEGSGVGLLVVGDGRYGAVSNLADGVKGTEYE
jgi:hypothetical protein